MEYNSIRLLVPTRGRVRNLERFIKSFKENADHWHLRVFLTFLIDSDDNETMSYLKGLELRDYPNNRVIVRSAGKPHLGKFFNMMYNQESGRDKDVLVSMLGDDMVCHTKGWDTKILEAMNKNHGMGIVHCRDGIQNGRIAVNFFTTQKWIEMTGLPFMPENWAADYIDVYHTELARRSGFEAYLDDVFVEHDHSSLRPPEQWDQTFKNLRAEWDGQDAREIMEGLLSKAMHNISGYLGQL